MAYGLGFGENAQASLITRGLAEMSRLGAACGANPLTFLGLAGIGDLIATCTSSLSRNRTFGENLAMGHKDPRAVHAQLMNSPGHRANLLKREFRAVGIGHACTITVELFGG